MPLPFGAGSQSSKSSGNLPKYSTESPELLASNFSDPFKNSNSTASEKNTALCEIPTPSHSACTHGETDRKFSATVPTPTPNSQASIQIYPISDPADVPADSSLSSSTSLGSGLSPVAPVSSSTRFSALSDFSAPVVANNPTSSNTSPVLADKPTPAEPNLPTAPTAPFVANFSITKPASDPGPTFKPGAFFSGTKSWKPVLDELELEGFEVPIFMKTAVRDQAFRPLHKSFTNPLARNISFRGRRFKNLDELKKQKFDNTIELSRDSLDEEIQKLLSNGTIKLVSKEVHEKDGGIINPILFIYSNKPRVVLHSLMNFSYTRPNFSMTNIHSSAERLLEEESLYKCDLLQAFFQFPIHDEEKKFFRFKLDNQIFQFEVLALGLSASPYIVHTAVSLLRQYYSLKNGHVMISSYLDDIFQSPSVESGVLFDQFAADYGLQF